MNNYRRNTNFFLVVFMTMLLFVRPACAQYKLIYSHYLDQAQESIQKKNYREALLYLETAQAVEPDSPEVTRYLNIVKRALEKRLEDVPVAQNQSDVSSPQKEKVAVPVPVQPVSKASRPKPKRTSETKTEVSSQQPERDAGAVQKEGDGESFILEMDDAAWAVQPDMQIELTIGQKFVLTGKDILRWLAITPGIITVSRESSREIVITPKSYGRTFLHVWDAKRRWTFHINVILQSQRAEREKKGAEMIRQQSVDPLRFSYDLSWSAFHQGPSLNKLDRQSLNVRHRLGVDGPSPYGDLDSYMVFYRTDQDSTEVTDYSVGLRNAKWKNFKDIDLRIFDAYKSVSRLTMPGRDFRGVLINGKTVDDKYSFTALRGKDRSTFGGLSSGLSSTRKSYIEAGQLAYQMDKKRTVTLNYAHAWGPQKPNTAKENVFSTEFRRNGDVWNVDSEAGYDQNEFAELAMFRRQFDGGSFFMKLRNLPRDYGTAVGALGSTGEIGSQFSLRHQFKGINVNHYLDLYRDRDNKNPEDENAINIDYNSSWSKRLSDFDSLFGSIYFIDTPGILADRTDFRLSGTYAHNFIFFNLKNANISYTTSYQRNRSDATPSSDYDRTGLMTNFSVPLNRYFRYTTSYEMYYVNDVAIDEKNYPTVFSTGLSYYHTLSDKWRLNSSVFYRDEERAEDAKSFLAGQDSLALTTGLDYSPRPGLNFYCDGRFRDVWAESSRSDAYMEADIRLGMRSEWDLGVTWNPAGIVQGYVFKDQNMNGKKDPDEPGIPGVRVLVGDGSAVTDKEGWYYSRMKAKKIRVSLDMDTIPQGFVFGKTSTYDFDIEHNKFYDGSFALTTQSGIYGVVYVDENHNNRPDNGDKFLSNVRLILDGKKKTVSDSRGSYFFYNISKGKHTLMLDMLSIPEEYLPKVPLKNEITVTEGATYVFHIPMTQK